MDIIGVTYHPLILDHHSFYFDESGELVAVRTCSCGYAIAIHDNYSEDNDGIKSDYWTLFRAHAKRHALRIFPKDGDFRNGIMKS